MALLLLIRDYPQTEENTVQTNQSARSYRATYHPQDMHDHPVASESGVLPSIRLPAPNTESASPLANAATGCVIAQVERLEDATKGVRPPPDQESRPGALNQIPNFGI